MKLPFNQGFISLKNKLESLLQISLRFHHGFSLGVNAGDFFHPTQIPSSLFLVYGSALHILI
jgi:hypothetical protein